MSAPAYPPGGFKCPECGNPFGTMDDAQFCCVDEPDPQQPPTEERKP